MDSQWGNSIRDLSRIADFRLKCCIRKENSKNNLTGRSDRKIQFAIFQNHLIGRIIDYTYEGAVQGRPGKQGLPSEWLCA
jgi:hypothetical protein